PGGAEEWRALRGRSRGPVPHVLPGDLSAFASARRRGARHRSPRRPPSALPPPPEALEGRRELGRRIFRVLRRALGRARRIPRSETRETLTRASRQTESSRVISRAGRMSRIFATPVPA